MHAAFSQSGKIDHSIREAIPEINIVIDDVLHCIFVPVDAKNMSLNAASAFVQVLRKGGRTETDNEW
jgi:hypothetical protein